MEGFEKLRFDPKAFNAKYGGATICKYGENHIVYEQGNAAGAIFNIQKGKVKLTVLSEHGKERVIAILEAGEFCGEGCLADQLLSISTATSMTDCVIVRLSGDDFQGWRVIHRGRADAVARLRAAGRLHAVQIGAGHPRGARRQTLSRPDRHHVRPRRHSDGSPGDEGRRLRFH